MVGLLRDTGNTGDAPLTVQFTDLVPGNFVAKQGMLVHLGKD